MTAQETCTEEEVISSTVVQVPAARQAIHVERPAYIEPVHVERPVHVKRPVHVERPRPIAHPAPRADLNIIYGLDEELDVERCFYEELQEFAPAEVANYFEEVIVETPFGAELLVSPPIPRLIAPPVEHDEIFQRCVHELIIPPTIDNAVRIPQVRLVSLDQITTGFFEWPIVRPARVLPAKTIEKTVSIPQMGFVDLCQDHPTDEHAVVIPTVHTVTIEQIVETTECDVVFPQVHTVWIPVMGDINIVQHRTKSRRIHLAQEWDCTIKCEDTKVHFLKLPQKSVGVSGTVIKNPEQDEEKICYNCHNSKCAGVGPSLLPVFIDETTPVQSVAAPVEYVVPKATAVQSSAPPRVETKYVEVIKEVPCEAEVEPTYVHHIKLGGCNCNAPVVATALNFAEHGIEDDRAYAGAFPWWLLPLLLLGLLLLSMLLAWLLCCSRGQREVVEAAPEPKVAASPTKKFVIEKRTKEEDEEEVEREIERQLQARAVEKTQQQQRSAAQATSQAQSQMQSQAQTLVKSSAQATSQAQSQMQSQMQSQAQSLVKSSAQAQSQAQAHAQSTVEEAKRIESRAEGALKQAVDSRRPESPGGSQRSAGRQRSSRGSGSSKKVVKKRIVKMMKQGKLVAEKEEILDEDGNVIRTEIRKEGLSSGSPSRSQA